MLEILLIWGERTVDDDRVKSRKIWSLPGGLYDG